MSAQGQSQLDNQATAQFDTQYSHTQTFSQPLNHTFHTSHVQSHKQTADTIVHPIHPSPAFHLPTNQSNGQSVKLPLLYDGEQQPFKRTAAMIGFGRHHQISQNMNLSLQWSQNGELIDWEKVKPFAVRDERERAARLERGEVEPVIDYTPQWQKELPPIILPVPAPSQRRQFPNILLGAYDDTCAHMFEQSESALALKALIEKRSAERLKAKSTIDEYGKWEPFASGDSQFFAPEPSGYTELYHDMSKGGPQKVQLFKHASSHYSLNRSNKQAYRGKDNRWTEERLYFRGYHTSDDYDPDDPNTHKTTSTSSADLLFDAPLYSSFAADQIFREPKSTKKVKPVQLTKVKTPRMNVTSAVNRLSRPASQPLASTNEKRISLKIDSSVSSRIEESKEICESPAACPSPLSRLTARAAHTLPVGSDVIVPCITMPNRPVVRFVSSTMLPMQKPREQRAREDTVPKPLDQDAQ